MKKIIYILSAAVLSLFAVSCELDNYDGPDAQVFGAFIDEQTGELIEQDINNGTRIAYIELGWDNPTTQYMICKPNGEYRNNLMFAADYDFFFNESNFVIPERLNAYTVRKGENRLDFKVTPYVRISDVDIRKVDDKVVATFTIQATQTGNVSKVGLFGHWDIVAGNATSLAKAEMNVNAPVTAPATYTLEIPADKFKAGKTYNFRVGALYSGGSVKYNYSHPVKVTI